MDAARENAGNKESKDEEHEGRKWKQTNEPKIKREVMQCELQEQLLLYSQNIPSI